jgi:hypothetical protein
MWVSWLQVIREEELDPTDARVHGGLLNEAVLNILAVSAPLRSVRGCCSVLEERLDFALWYFRKPPAIAATQWRVRTA